MKQVAVLACALLASCGNETASYDALADHVASERVGHAPDHWIEMLNMAGEWERTGLVFGYADDRAECRKVIAGLKQANPARQYRCTTAN